MTVQIQADDFNLDQEMARLSGREASDIGAIASFVGVVRGMSGGKQLQSMELEHYPGMTEMELETIEAVAVQRFRLSASRIIHRVGVLRPGDRIVLVMTASPHRQDALDGCAYLMDYLKTRAPFWKKEVGQDGSATWVDARDSDDAALARWNGE